MYLPIGICDKNVEIIKVLKEAGTVNVLADRHL